MLSLIYVRSLEPQLVSGQTGIVLGRCSLAEANRRRIRALALRCVLDGLALPPSSTAAANARTYAWGNYVAFVADPLTGPYLVAEDPCGSLPCFSTTFRGSRSRFQRFGLSGTGSIRFTVTVGSSSGGCTARHTHNGTR